MATDWGTTKQVMSSGAADAYARSLEQRFPRTESAYVPSGKMGLAALPWLAVGSAAGAIAGGATALVAGGVTLLLLALMGGVIAVIAACGWVVCMTVAIELGIALIGGGITFVLTGAVPAWIVGWAGKKGKNRSRAAAAVFALPSALFATVVLFGTPYLIALFVPPPVGDEISFAQAVHAVAGTTWMHAAVVVVGTIIALGTAALVAHSEVGLQKFCERCQRYMDEVHVPGASFDRAEWIFAQLRASAAADVVPHLAGVAGERDVELSLFRCSGCSSGYFEGRAHARTEWRNAKAETQSRHTHWCCFSIATTPRDTETLRACEPPREPA